LSLKRRNEIIQSSRINKKHQLAHAKQRENMAINEKISKSLKSAMAFVEDSMSALNKKDDSVLADSSWHVGAELEYALFLLSMAFTDESEMSRFELNPKLEKTELDSMLLDLKNMLQEAENFFTDGKLLEAYERVYVARHYALKINGELAKKKREMQKKK
jgi:hypothetical protein